MAPNDPVPALFPSLRWVHRGNSLEEMLASEPEIVALDRPGPDEIIARVEAVSICSSDIKVVRMGADHPLIVNAGGAAQTVLGHEMCLRVCAVGPAVAGRFRIGQRLALQPAMRVDGRRRIIGFDEPGGFAQFIRLGPEALAGHVFDVPEHLSAAEIALLEPYGCVERAYRPNARTELSANGSALLVIGPAAGGYRLGGRPDWSRLTVVAPPGTRLPADAGPVAARFEAIGEVAGMRFDDIIALGELDSDTLARLPPLLAEKGLLLQARQTPLAEVPIDAARVHYDALSFVGTTSATALDALAEPGPRFDVRAGGIALVHGAGGAMGRIHVHRLLQHAAGPRTVIATSRKGGRLSDLAADFGPLAVAGGRDLVVVGADRLSEAVAKLAPDGLDDAVVVAPDAAAVAGVSSMLAPDGLLSIFAGFAYGHTVSFDLAGVATGGKRITGSTGCSVDDMKDVLAKVLSGDLDLTANIKAIAGLRALPQALHAVSRGIVSGKVVVYPQSPDMPFGPVDGSGIRAREQWLVGGGERPAPQTGTGRSG